MPSKRRMPPSPRFANSYDFVRFCAASAVLFSHHFDLAGYAEPSVPGYGEDFGQLGVQVFFCLSGFLICRSLHQSTDWRRFLAARVTRLLPNLVFVLVTASLVTLIWYRNWEHAADHLGYVASNLAMFVSGVMHDIPGVFTDAVRPAVNEPLWTLPYEVWLYVALFLMVAGGGKWAGPIIVLAAILFSLAWGFDVLEEVTIGPVEGYEMFRLGTFFLCGATLGVLWPQISAYALPLGIAGLASVFAAVNWLPGATIAQALALAACVVGLGQSKSMAWFSKGGDASYGIYVFAWPVQQFCLLLIAPFWLSLSAAFAVTVAAGYSTWHLFEKRAIANRGRLADWLRFERKPQRRRVRRAAPIS